MTLITDHQRYLLTLLVFFVLSNVNAASTYEITRYSINNGGGKSDSASFELSASIGQGTAGEQAFGSTMSVSAGFWTAVTNNDAIFINGFE